MSEKLTEARRDDLMVERDLLVDMVAKIDELVRLVEHRIQFHERTGIYTPGLTDLGFAKMIGMECRSGRTKRLRKAGKREL